MTAKSIDKLYNRTRKNLQIELPKKIDIKFYDTTLRDGAQAVGVNFSKNDKLKISHRIDDLGIHYIEGGWPNITNKSDIEFFNEVKNEGLKSKIIAFGRTKKPNKKSEEDEDIQILLDVDPDLVTIMGKAWTFHVKKILETTLDENLNMIRDTLEYFSKHGFQTIFDAEHFIDGFKEDPEYALKVLEVAEEAGTSELILCDTRGASTPLEVYKVTNEVLDRFKLPVGIHAHNDRGLATANSVFAVLGGSNHIQGTINGIGERCGNADLIEVICNVEFSLGIRTGIKLKMLTEVSDYIYEIANLPGNSYKPFVGKSAFSHKGGIHGHAVLKTPTAYEGLDPSTVGNRRSITVSSQAGVSNVIAKGREFKFQIDKKSDEARNILLKIKNLESEGYSFENANASLHLLYAKELGEKLDYFNLVNWRAYVLCDDGKLSTESTVKINLGEKSIITAAEGNGPVNAFDRALRKALSRQYPELSRVKLIGYRVRELEVEEGTAAAVRVFTEFKANNTKWSTIGVSPNILKASEEALIDGYRYYLYRHSKPNYSV